jgi:hypothetical protein
MFTRAARYNRLSAAPAEMNGARVQEAQPIGRRYFKLPPRRVPDSSAF